MAEINKIHVHYVGFDKKRHTKSFTPSEQGNTLRLKQDIARILSPIKNDYEYYYVTAEMEGKDGKPLFRTLTKKIFF